MPEHQFDTDSRRTTHHWLILGVGALIFSGLFAILLVASRTPGVSSLIPWLDFFHTALVVHVDLSVLIWFLSISCVFWSHHSDCRHRLFERAALWLAVAGTAGMIVAPFTGEAHPVINNYIPMLDQTWFAVSLLLVGIGFFIKALLRLTALPDWRHAPLSTGSWLAAVCAVVGCVALAISYITLPTDLEPVVYFERLFWGPGHILQIGNTVLVLVAWLILAQAGSHRTLGIPDWLVSLFLLLTALPVIDALVIYATQLDNSTLFHARFTDLMRYGGLASLPIGLAILPLLFLQPQQDGQAKILRSSLRQSVLLFLAGGVLGFMISGVNVVIPAHYHGSIVGVTLAFMGVAYYLMPKLGVPITLPRLAYWQPIVYGIGQLIHITGLAWSGGYGVQRKTAGAAQGLERLPEVISMGMMGLGGLIAIIGGMLFVIVFLHASFKAGKA